MSSEPARSQPIDGTWREHVGRLPPLTGVLLCPPEHFQVVDVKNAFMAEGIGSVDAERATAQWRGLADTYAQHGVAVHAMAPAAGREDMVFTCNAVCVLPRADGGLDVVPSHMRHESRQAEVPHVLRWLAQRGARVASLPGDCGHLEGHGDVLAVPGRRLLLGGHGGRSDATALTALADLLDVPVVPLPLVAGSRCYHLDTCLAVLDEDAVLLHPPALSGEALATLATLFPRRIEADPAEAEAELACNVHALPDGHVLIPAGATRTARALARAGYEPVPVDVSEFHKSGGSVFCMKLALPDLPGAPGAR